jgi:delta-aminolevulinic acid dehydratase/porphobilinogen synthase
MIMVKPGLPYLDILRSIKDTLACRPLPIRSRASTR